MNEKPIQDLFLATSQFTKEKKYWLEKLQGDLVRTTIPHDYIKGEADEFKAAHLDFAVPDEVAARLVKMSNKSDQRLFLMLAAGMAGFVYRFTGIEDCILGVPIYHQVIEGKFINTLVPLRQEMSAQESFKGLILAMRQVVHEAYEHQNYPMERLLAELRLTTEKKIYPLSGIGVFLTNVQEKGYIEHVNFDLTFGFTRKDEAIQGVLEYNAALYKRETVERVVGHLLTFLSNALVQIEEPLNQVEILSAEERDQILHGFNNIRVDYPKQLRLHELFEAQVEKTPQKVAVMHEGQQLTYVELNERADRLAQVLRSKGVGPNQIVGMMVTRSLEMMVGIFGILKAGGAYLPIDPKYPKERIEYMLADSQIRILLTLPQLRDAVEFGGEVLDLTDERLYMVEGQAGGTNGQRQKESVEVDGRLSAGENTSIRLESEAYGEQISPDNLAYIIYTSGSTGKPKGVMVQHKNVVAYIHSFLYEFPLTAEDVTLQQASYAFDASVEELYPVLTVGGTLVLPKDDAVLDAGALAELINEHRVTILSCSPLMLNEFNKLPALKSVHTFINGGDVLKSEYITNLLKYAKVYNTYGPTESTVCATYYRCNAGQTGNMPIGRPIANYRGYVLDKHQQLLPIGVPGELCVAGPGVTPGYLNRPEMTAEKFQPNPFQEGELIYRTGDLARWLPNGNIEFLGRIDHQVKIRGYRIELGEIENELLKHPAVAETVVIDRIDSDGTKYLCAYIVSPEELSIADIRAHLAVKLPEYMIPSYFVQLKRMPQNANGKIDRKALPEPDGSIQSGIEYVAPRDEVEGKLARIWTELLGVERVGIYDNFFELGGHSLKATSLVAKVSKEMEVELPLKEVFHMPTIAHLADYIKKAESSRHYAIERVLEREVYPVSSAQKRLFIINQLENDTSYNLPAVMEIRGELDHERLEEVFRQLSLRHEALRTSFVLTDGEPVQRIHPTVEFAFTYLEGEAGQLQKAVDEFIQPFDLRQAPLFKVAILKTSEEQYLLFDMHHIISDGVSMDILIGEMLALYEGVELPEMRIQYKDFAVWQNDFLQSERIAKEEEYWLQRLQGELPVLNMSTDYPRPAVMNFTGDKFTFTLEKQVSARLKGLCASLGVTQYMFLLAAYNVLLSKYTGQNDLLVASPIAGRPHVDLEKIVGMFVNTLIMRNQLSGDETFAQFLEAVKANALKAWENQDYQFETLVEKVVRQRDLSRNPLFDTMFVLQETNIGSIGTDKFTLIPVEFEYGQVKFDLGLDAVETEQGFKFDLRYSTSLFKGETMERLAEHYLKLVRDVVANPELCVKEIELVSAEEKQMLVSEWNHTETDYPRRKTLHQLFAEVAGISPEKTALTLNGAVMSYGELHQRSNQVARYLRNKGVQPDEIVGILVERSFDMVVGLLGILKAGGAYLPIDPTHPEARIQFMLEDSGTRLLLTQQGLADGLIFAGEWIDLGDIAINLIDDSDLTEVANAENLAYVIYTSGTTGKPKGNLTTHANVSRVVKETNYVEIKSTDRILQLSNYAFDGSTFDLYGALLNGATLVLVDTETVGMTSRLARVIAEERITVFFVTTALFNVLVDTELEALRGVRKILFGGERVSVRHVEKAVGVLGSDVILHVYGPTESTVYATYYPVSALDPRAETVPIGRPLANTRIYILDAENRVVPMGVPGEICVAGEGLARGYLNQPELTAEKFVPDPFRVGERMYRTGDLARWLSDGNIEFLGRIDNQVKLRGFRIELGEIEKQLLAYASIKEAVVMDREDEPGNKYLVAYYTGSKELAAGELKDFLNRELPEYMIPAYFIWLEKMPLNLNGKIEKRALPAPHHIPSGREYVAPTNECETRLAAVWSELLGVKQVGVTDNFFELGGHSLKATVLAARIVKEFGREIPLKEIFKAPTIKQMAQILQDGAEADYVAIESVKRAEFYPVSSAQKRVYIVNQLGLDETTYNMPGVMEIRGILDTARLTDALQKLVQRHEALRTYFTVENGAPVQRIEESVQVTLEEYQVMDSALEGEISNFIRPFNLQVAPLFRVGILRSETLACLLFDLHHIIADGVSMDILVRDLSKLYEGQELEPLRIQYKDFAVWQNSLQTSERMQELESFWLGQFAGELPVLNLPTDYPRPAVMSFAGDNLELMIDSSIAEALRRLAQNEGATLYMTLLALFNVFLHKYSGQEEIIVGTPIAGRQHADLEGVLGMFVNTLPLRNYPVRDKSFVEFLEQVKECTLDAFEHQEYQLEQMIEQLDLTRDLSRNPLFDVVFTVQNAVKTTVELGDSKLIPYSFANPIAKFDLTLTATEVSEGIHLNFEYCTDLFTRATIERMAEHFTNLVQVVVNAPESLLSSYEVISRKEREMLLNEFNPPKTDYPHTKTLAQLFLEQVQRVPEQVALRFFDREMTYRELDQLASKLALSLRQKGVVPNEPVGIMIGRSMEMIVAIIAILKAGGAYLPIDPEYPEARIQFILEDSGTQLLLTSGGLARGIGEYKGEVLDVQELLMSQEELVSEMIIDGNAEDLAYILYTSGTTGRPKGSLLSQYNVSRLVKNTNYITITEADRVLQTLNYVFDGSVFEIFGALLNGATLVLIDKDTLLQPHRLTALIEADRITVILLTTALFNVIVDTGISGLKGVRKLLFGGERVSVRHVEKAYEVLGSGRIIHVYGPTESTVFATTYQVDELIKDADTLSIGYPVANTEIYILDSEGHLQPVGVTGEICIGGAGLAKGYLNRQELTQEKFVANPFREGERMYHSGDLGRWLPNGQVEFVGRVDNQVKIRGFRIELGEIEKQLLSYEGVKEAVVIVKDDETGGKYLSAYIVTAGVEVSELRETLARELPEYMIPAYFVQLPALPLNANGKVDIRHLPEPEGVSGREYRAPETLVEMRLAAIWSEILGVERVGQLDHFFELGGHSLKATLLTARIYQEFGVELPLRKIFQTPTVKELAACIEETERGRFAVIPQVNHEEYYPLSSAQKRLYMLSQMGDQNTGYNMPGVMVIEGELDQERFSRVFERLIERHESLRTSFVLSDHEPMQKVHAGVDFKVQFMEAVEQDVQGLIENFVQPFDLTKAPLLRVGLVRVTDHEAKYYFIFDLHHIISDGTSMGLLTNEFVRLYEGEELPPLRVQYKDYAVWQNQLLSSEEMDREKEYWLGALAGELPTLNMPLDFPRPKYLSFAGDTYHFIIERDLTDELQALAKSEGATLYMVLLAAYNLFLAKYTGQSDIIVGTPIAGRPHSDLQHVIGMFINTLALRNQPEGAKTFRQFLTEVKENALLAYENQDFQFEMLVEELVEEGRLKTDVGRNPLFDTMFTLQNLAVDINLRLSGLKLSTYEFENRISKFDFSFNGVELEEGLRFSLIYSTKLFTRETVMRMAEHYQNILRAIIANPDESLAEIRMLSEEEQAQFKVTGETPELDVDFNF